MKIVRWAAAVALTLISLMGIGLVTGSGDINAAFRVIGPVCGVLGLIAVYGLLRRRHWGMPGALAVCALNVIGGLVDLAVDGAAPLPGVVVSVVALLLTVAAAYRPGRCPARRPGQLAKADHEDNAGENHEPTHPPLHRRRRGRRRRHR